MPSFGSILHFFAPLGAGEGAPTPHRIIFVANLAYFAILVMTRVTLFLVMAYPSFSTTHTFVRPNAPSQAPKNLLKGVLLVFPTLKIGCVVLTCPHPPQIMGVCVGGWPLPYYAICLYIYVCVCVCVCVLARLRGKGV